MHFLDVPHRRTLNAMIKYFDFPQPCYSKMWSVQLQFFSEKTKNPPVVMENYAFRYRGGTIFIQVLFFSHNQYFVASLTNSDFSSLFSYSTLRFPMQTLLKKNHPVVTEKFDFEKPDESIWNAFIECFALAKNRCTDQKVWLSTPLILYKCEVAYWGFIFGIF